MISEMKMSGLYCDVVVYLWSLVKVVADPGQIRRILSPLQPFFVVCNSVLG